MICNKTAVEQGLLAPPAAAGPGILFLENINNGAKTNTEKENVSILVQAPNESIPHLTIMYMLVSAIGPDLIQ